ncbi:MAG TPA: hypothetical protein VGB30_11505 [bacterium]|jgi:hypothetical protein
MRKYPIIIFGLAIFLLTAVPASAEVFDFMDGISLGAGFNQGSDNDANESAAFSIKIRQPDYQYGVDFLMSEDRGGIGDNNFGFVWGTWYTEFKRAPNQDYGFYAGAGAGAFFLEDDFIDWPAGPFAMLGWDFSTQAGIEGKVGYFGENMWGTAIFYWNFGQ